MTRCKTREMGVRGSQSGRIELLLSSQEPTLRHLRCPGFSSSTKDVSTQKMRSSRVKKGRGQVFFLGVKQVR